MTAIGHSEHLDMLGWNFTQHGLAPRQEGAASSRRSRQLLTSPGQHLTRSPLFEGNSLSGDAIAAFQAHTEFPSAMRVLAAGATDLYLGNRVTNTVMTDRGRFLISVFAVYLHSGSRPADPNSGLTVSRMRALCAEQKFCSPGRAEAMLGLMRLFGYLESAPSEDDRRLRRLMPTERLMTWHRQRCEFTFAALAKVLPEGNEALAALRAPGFLTSFLGHLARRYLAGLYYVDYVPDMKLFLDRNAGLVSLFSLLLSAGPGDTFPPRGPLSVPLSALARRYGTSRPHVRRLIQDAIAEGFFERIGEREGDLRVLPRLAEALCQVVAMYLLHNAHCARAALAETADKAVVA